MVVDRLENLEKYASLNPLFAKAMEYLKTTDLNAQELGKVKLQGDDLVVLRMTRTFSRFLIWRKT